jgi:hypothetical protein
MCQMFSQINIDKKKNLETNIVLIEILLEMRTLLKLWLRTMILTKNCECE